MLSQLEQLESHEQSDVARHTDWALYKAFGPHLQIDTAKNRSSTIKTEAPRNGASCAHRN